MGNPLMGKNMPTNNGNNPFSAMMQFMKNGGNPQQAMQMLMQKNPKTGKMLTQLQNMANGRSPKQFAMDLAKQKGVDIKDVEDFAQMIGAK